MAGMHNRKINYNYALVLSDIKRPVAPVVTWSLCSLMDKEVLWNRYEYIDRKTEGKSCNGTDFSN